MQSDELIREEAALWAVRTGDRDFIDWDAFTAWLERDPAHAQAYDSAVLAVEDAARLGATTQPLESPQPANDQGPAIEPRRRWAMPALAAAVAGLAAIGLWQLPGGEATYQTAPGQTQTIALADGSSIALAGGSRLVVEGSDGRAARLESGRALFTIRHDAGNPFVLVAGQDTLVDAGTIFDVSMASDRLDVEVAEGAVIVNPQSVKIRLAQGARATRRAGDWQVGQIAPASVGLWREGQISFREATLSEIAAELSRASGLRIRAEDRSAMPLSGSVAIDELRRDPASLGPLLGVTVEQRGEEWVISPG